MDNEIYKDSEFDENQKNREIANGIKAEEIFQIEDDDYLYKPEELNQIISEFISGTTIERGIEILKEIAFDSTNLRAAYSIAKDERGESTFLEYLLSLFEGSFPRQFIPHILRIFSNTLDIHSVHEFFFERNPVGLFYAILEFQKPPSFEEISNFVKSPENSSITHELVFFISKLAKKNISTKSVEEMISFWQNFTYFLMSIVQNDDIDTLIDAFKSISLIINKHNDLRISYLHNDLMHYCFRRFEHFQVDFPIVCKLIGSLTYFCDFAFHFFPDDWISLVSDKLVSVDTNSVVLILDMIISFTSITDICTAIIESDFIHLLLDYSHEAAFDIRKNCLKVIIEVFIDGRDNQKFIDFLLDCENLDFFIPFMETDDHEVMFTVLRALVDVVDETEVTIQNGIPPLYSVFADSNEIMLKIEEISEYEVDDDDHDYEHELVECAQIILSKMISNREIAESL